MNRLRLALTLLNSLAIVAPVNAEGRPCGGHYRKVSVSVQTSKHIKLVLLSETLSY